MRRDKTVTYLTRLSIDFNKETAYTIKKVMKMPTLQLEKCSSNTGIGAALKRGVTALWSGKRSKTIVAPLVSELGTERLSNLFPK